MSYIFLWSQRLVQGPVHGEHSANRCYESSVLWVWTKVKGRFPTCGGMWEGCVRKAQQSRIRGVSMADKKTEAGGVDWDQVTRVLGC